jgi:ADP-heptose:LPS heptosyltransferase
MDENEVKYLIVRFSSIGDIVLTTPVVRCLKQQVEGATVHYLTKPQYANLLKDNPYIDKVHTLKSYRETIAELKAEGFDYIIDLHKNLRSKRFRSRLKVMDFTFPKLNKEKWLKVNLKKDSLPDIHIVDRYFKSVELFDVENDEKGLDYFIPKVDEVNLSDYFDDCNEQFVSYAIGGQHFTKKMPANKIAEICSRIEGKVILLGGKEDFESGEEIGRNCQNAVNLCGKLNLNQSADIVKKSKLLISHDTGLMHIGSALKKDILSVWGNTIPEFGMYPYLAGEKSVQFEIKDLKCRPCSKIGHTKCPKNHFKCMEDQNTELIAAKANEILNNK